jgi:hypothetical protein
MGYQYTLHQRRKKLREERDMFMRSQGDDSMSSEEHWNEYSDASQSSMERYKDPKHKRRTTSRVVEEIYMRSPSTNEPEEEEEFVQETPEAALIAAHAYLLTTKPKPGDPREQMHQAVIRSLGLVEEKLKGNISEKSRLTTVKGKKKRKSANLRGTKLASPQKTRKDKRGRRMQGT